MKALYDAVRHVIDSGILDHPGVGIPLEDGVSSISPQMRKALLEFEKRTRDHCDLLYHPDLHVRHMDEAAPAPLDSRGWAASVRQPMYDAYVDLFLAALSDKWDNKPFAPELDAVLDAYDPQGYVARLARYEAANRLQHCSYIQGSPSTVTRTAYLSDTTRPYRVELFIGRGDITATRTVALADIECSTLRGACELVQDAHERATALFVDIDSWPEFAASDRPSEASTPAKAVASGMKVTLPAGLIDILREAAAIIGNIDPRHAPGNLRQPIVDELEGFASMLYGEIQATGVSPTAEARTLTETDRQELRLALARIYHGRYTSDLSVRMSDTEMADLAEPFALTKFAEPSAEHQALHAIYLGRYCADPAKRLTDTQLAEIAKPFVVVPDSSGSMTEPALPREENRRYLVLRVTGETPEDRSTASPSPTAEEEPGSPAVPVMSRHAAVAEALRPYCTADQRVIWQERSAWHDEEGELAAPYCYKSLSGLVEDLDYDIIADYNHVAIIQRRR